MMFYRWIMGGRRRCLRTPRPLLLLLLLAIYFFSETLWMIGWRRYSLKCTSEYDSWRDISELKEHLSRSNQRPLSLQTIQKIELLHLKHFGKQVKTVTFYGHHSIGVPEFQLYQRILTSYGYKVSIPEEDKLELIFNQEEDSFSTWDLLISFASGKDHISCNENYHLYHFQPYQKVNTLPEMKHILCRKEELCLMGKQFPELELSAVLSFCLDQKTSHNFPRSDTKMTKMNGLDDSIILAKIKNRTQVSSPELYQTFKQITPQDVLKEQEVSIMMKVYVLVTALRPLRAFIHSDGLVWNEQNKKYFATKLQSFFKNLLGVESSVQALNNIKETICKILLTAEMLTKASATERKTLQRCTLCFQFLTFDISFINTLHPVVLEIHGEYDFRDVKDIDSRDQSIEETILEDTFYILMSNLSVATTMYAVLQTMPSSVGIKDENCQSMHLHCFSLEDFISVISFFKELNCTGKYEVVYPTSSQNYQTLLYHLYSNLDHHGELDSVMEMHLFLSELLEHFQLQNMQRESTGSPLWNITQEGHKGRASSLRHSERNTGLLNQRHCSYDKSTLHLIREIRTSPKLNLHPEFKPEIREYYCEVPFDTVTVRIEAVPANCQCQVHLDHTQGPRIDNYPLGLGNNRISLLVTRESHSDPVLMGTYIINIYRENRPTLPLFNEYELCGFVQDCGLQIWPAESCGLQCLPTNYLSVISQLKFNSCKSGDAKGQWIVPCLSCSDNRTCDWREITWQPYSCQHPVLPRHQLQQCLDSRKVLFIGDSTNRGIMYYLIERVNDTLQEWDKEHGTKLYPNVNGRRTFVSYSYYPQFWLDFKEKPTFENSLEQLIQRSRPLKNNDQTVLVVGGVQWLNKDHLHILQRVLQRENLLNILVVIKSIGIGFHLPVEGIRSLSLYEVQNLWEENLKILYTAKQYGYEVVDTFSITVGRYKEFMQGKCACHFHEVVTSNISEEYSQKNMILRHAKSEKDFKSTIRKSELQEFLFNSKSHYHVKGPVNQVYSEIILSRICTHKNNSTAT